MTNFGKIDTFELCGMRFDKWYHCDIQYSHEKKAELYKNHEEYPCFQHFYEAQYSCSDQLFDFMLELAYARRQNQTNLYEKYNRDLTTIPTIYDTPDVNNRIKLTY